MLLKDSNIIKLKNSVNKIWVITAAYNEGFDKWLRCIKSVKSQTTNYEIMHLIICDGVCQNYQKHTLGKVCTTFAYELQEPREEVREDCKAEGEICQLVLVAERDSLRASSI